MSDDRDLSARPPVWPLVVFGLLCCYVASIGPAAWLVDRLGVSPFSTAGGVVQTLYWPVEYLVSRFEAVDDAVRWYVRLFVP